MLYKHITLVNKVEDLNDLVYFDWYLFITYFIIFEEHIAVDREEKWRFFILVYYVTEC